VLPVPEPVTVARAKLSEIELADGEHDAREVNREADISVQFNPESLRVGYSNTLEGEDQAGGSAIQFVSKSSTKLTVELWFDASVDAAVKDVRELTKKVNHFVTPKAQGDGMAPPGVRFLWGSFLFEGVMESMDETLEFFSAEGRPLRAKVGVVITSQEIQFHIAEIARSQAAVPGTTPQTPVAEGQSLQQAMDRDGSAEGWQDVAEANGIENPRNLPPGSLVNTRPPAGPRGAGGRR
jgi:hypothetical protein